MRKIWVIESLEGKGWLPIGVGYLTRHIGRQYLRGWKRSTSLPSRLVPYVPTPQKPRRKPSK